MAGEPLHSWDLTPQEAAEAQSRLCGLLSDHWDDREVRTIGGVDISVQEAAGRAAIVVLRYPDMTVIEMVTAEVPLTFPYVPGLLAFREGPAVLAAWAKLENMPDIVMFDGQGIAHPRGLGIAAQMGLWLDKPTIGVAKSRLYGRHADPGPNPGDMEYLYDQREGNKVIGVVLRSKARSKPLYVSPGHKMDVEHAAEFVKACITGYRLPEPTRRAHQIAGGGEGS